MKDYKAPWVRKWQPEDYYNNVSFRQEATSVFFAVCLICAMIVMLIESIDKEAAIEEARNMGRMEARAAILKANQDLLKGNEHYVKQMDKLIAKEYRNEKK